MNKFLRYSFVALLAMFVGNVYADDVTDVLTWEGLGLDGTSSSYVAFSDKKITSDAIYAGTASSGQGKYIQLRTKNSNEGIVTTTSGGKLKTIKITFNEATTDRSIEIYGKNEAYASAADLFGDAKGTLLATIAANAESKTLNVEGDYTFIGLKSANSAIYVDKIEITWTTADGGGSSTIFSWEGAEGGAIVSGGSVVASDGESVNYPNSDYYTIRINKKKNDIATDNVEITLDNALAANDEIAITGYRNKDTDANGTLYILFENGAFIDEGDAVVWNNIHSAVGQQPNTNTYKITDAAGSKSMKIARSTASTNVFITKIVITSGGTSGIGTVKTIRVDDGAIYNLAGQKVDNSYKGVVIKNGKKFFNK